MTKKEKLIEELVGYFGEEQAEELETKTIKELESVLEAMQGSKAEEAIEQEEDNEGSQAPVEEEIDPALIGPDGKELLFEGGPSLEKVEEWKSRFAGEVYLSEFDDDIFLWRPINRKEYKDVMKIQGADSFYKEERICERVVLFPENYSFMAMTAGKAGIPTLLSENIMEKSGFQQSTPIRL